MERIRRAMSLINSEYEAPSAADHRRWERFQTLVKFNPDKYRVTFHNKEDVMFVILLNEFFLEEGRIVWKRKTYFKDHGRGI